jgi:peroxiredoxin
MSQAYNAHSDTSQMVYIAFGKAHPNSWLGLDILYRNRLEIGKDTIKALLSQVKGAVKSSPEAVALDAFASGKTTEKGLALIDFTVKTIEGKPFTLSDLKGRYVLLNFWNPGCVPCLWEFKEINKHYDQLKHRLTIVSFNIGSNKDQWLTASKRSNIQWTNVSDLAGDNGKIKTQYNVQGIPNSFLINPQGVIVETFIGFNENDFIPKIEALIK